MLHAEYIRGLVDGEGSFTVFVRDPHATKERRRRAKVEPRFIVKLQECDRPILEELVEFFRCGRIYLQKDHRANHATCFRYEVHARDDLRRVIIPFFREYPPQAPSKKRDFDLFVAILELLAQDVHATHDGLERIWTLKRRMHQGSRSAGNPLATWERQSRTAVKQSPVTPRESVIPEAASRLPR